MKKFAAFLFALTLFVTMTVAPMAAEYTIGADGNAVYDTAIGYVFDIDDVNGAIEGEDATVITNNESLAKIGSKWAIWFLAEKEAGDIYRVITNGTAMGGDVPSVTLKEDQIFVAVHSSSSNPNDAAKFPNWEDKVAALAVKAGDWLAFDYSFDLDNETGMGMMMVVTEAEVLAGLIEFPERNPNDPTQPIEPDEPSTPDESVNSAEESAAQDEVDDTTDEEIKHSDIKTDGETSVIAVSTDTGVSDPNAKEGGWFDSWKWVIFGFAGGFLVVALVLFLRKPAKKAAKTEEAPAESGEQAPESNEENKAE